MTDYLIVDGSFLLVFAVLWVAWWRAGVSMRRDRELEQQRRDAAAERR